MRSHRVAVAVAIAVVLGVGAGVIPAAASTGPEPSKSTGKKPSKSKVKTITVADDYFSLARLTVKKGQKIKWVWSRQNFDSHNVTLVSGPKGVSHQAFTSATGVFGVKFERTLLRPGRYHFQCTIHPESMNIILTVRK
jgi:plastocyanin